jgi:serine/threonine protein kinase
LKFLKKFPTSYYSTYIVECFGITQEPKTLNYALVLKLKDCSLRKHLDKNYNSLTFKDKLDIITKICLGLDCIHNHNIIHRDLHLGNILYSKIDRRKFDISISDFGFCKPAFETSEVKNKLFGVMPYMAPEVWVGKGYTKKSDIYSFGVIINEIISGSKPFHNIPHDHQLAIDICRHGLRPGIRSETPEALKDLINRCWDANPENRPNTYQIYTMLQDFIYTKNDRGSHNFKEHTEEYKELEETSHIADIIITKDSPSGTREDNPQIKYKSKLINLPDLSTFTNSSPYIIRSGKFCIIIFFKKKASLLKLLLYYYNTRYECRFKFFKRSQRTFNLFRL